MMKPNMIGRGISFRDRGCCFAGVRTYTGEAKSFCNCVIHIQTKRYLGGRNGGLALVSP